ncbi:MAG: 3-oxoacyl-[acyl-carrier-protein] reductase [Chlamydiia bacterium]|nr:3-oxoacyl-[acyl-carrier-protein] reductase [Chlamydiia bacterium]
MTSGLLAEQITIVTGGTAGIGKAIAQAFIAEGARVALFGSNAERGAAAVQELGDAAAFFQVDVADFAAVEAAVKAVTEQLGPPSILVNNAGITRDNLLLRMKEEDWDRVLEVNLKSCFNTCKAVARSMMKARRGKIINISSVVGIQGNPGQANYAASKAGMLGYTKALARELAARDINVNAIAPGYIRTAMTDALNDGQKDAVMGQIPLGRIGHPDDIAQAAVFLATANYITGQTLVVDGGMAM